MRHRQCPVSRFLQETVYNIIYTLFCSLTNNSFFYTHCIIDHFQEEFNPTDRIDNPKEHVFSAQILFVLLIIISFLLSYPAYLRVRRILQAQDIEYEMAYSDSNHSTNSCLSLGYQDDNSQHSSISTENKNLTSSSGNSGYSLRPLKIIVVA